MRGLIFLALSFCVTSCATKAPTSARITAAPADRLFANQTKTEGSGELVVTRDIGHMASGCPMGFLIDGAVAGHLRTGERASFYVAEGEHIIGAEPAGKGICSWGDPSRSRNEIGITVKPGETKRYRVGVDANGRITMSPTTF